MTSDHLSILQLQPNKQAQLMYQFYKTKTIDKFIQNCQLLMSKNIKLSSLNHLFSTKMDLDNQYHQIQRVKQRIQAIIQQSKKPSLKQDGWKQIQIKEKVFLAAKDKGTFLQLKCHGQLDISIKKVLIVAYLMKFYGECFPFCKQAKDLGQPSPLQKIGYLRISLPIPLIKDRAALLRGMGLKYDKRARKVYIFAQGITQNKQLLQRGNINANDYLKGRQVLDIKHFGVQIECLGQNKISFNGYALVDHHIPLIPQKLIVFVVKQFAKYVFNKLIHKLQNFQSTVWAKQLKQNYKQNEQFYNWIDLLVKDWLISLSKM